MNNLARFLGTTVGKKFLVGITGLAMAGFLLAHMAGNLLLFVGPEAYNGYSYKLTSTSLIYVAEAGLIFVFLIHVGLTISLTLRNNGARPEGYLENARGPKRTSWAAKTLILSGLLVFVFIVLHLINFKFGEQTTTTVNNVEMRDLYSVVSAKFKNPGYVAWYVFALLVLSAHVRHGISATFQSLGISSVKNVSVQRIGLIFTVVVMGGFIAQPIYMYFFGV